MDFVKDNIGLALSVLALGGWIWNWLQAPSTSNAKELAAVRKEMADDRKKAADERENTEAETRAIGDRVYALETVVKQLPTKDDFHGIDKGLTEVRGKMDALSQSVAETSRTAHRIEDYMLKAS